MMNISRNDMMSSGIDVNNYGKKVIAGVLLKSGEVLSINIGGANSMFEFALYLYTGLDSFYKVAKKLLNGDASFMATSLPFLNLRSNIDGHSLKSHAWLMHFGNIETYAEFDRRDVDTKYLFVDGNWIVSRDKVSWEELVEVLIELEGERNVSI